MKLFSKKLMALSPEKMVESDLFLETHFPRLNQELFTRHIKFDEYYKYLKAGRRLISKSEIYRQPAIDHMRVIADQWKTLDDLLDYLGEEISYAVTARLKYGNLGTYLEEFQKRYRIKIETTIPNTNYSPGDNQVANAIESTQFTRDASKYGFKNLSQEIDTDFENFKKIFNIKFSSRIEPQRLKSSVFTVGILSRIRYSQFVDSLSDEEFEKFEKGEIKYTDQFSRYTIRFIIEPETMLMSFNIEYRNEEDECHVSLGIMNKFFIPLRNFDSIKFFVEASKLIKNYFANPIPTIIKNNRLV